MAIKVNLVEKDTQYSPQLEVQQYNAIKNQVAMFGESLGTPTTQAIVQSGQYRSHSGLRRHA